MPPERPSNADNSPGFSFGPDVIDALGLKDIASTRCIRCLADHFQSEVPDGALHDVVVGPMRSPGWQTQTIIAVKDARTVVSAYGLRIYKLMQYGMYRLDYAHPVGSKVMPVVRQQALNRFDSRQQEILRPILEATVENDSQMLSAIKPVGWKMLQVLMSEYPSPVSSSKLSETLAKNDALLSSDHLLYVHLGRLRRDVENIVGDAVVIQTLPGVGYAMTTE